LRGVEPGIFFAFAPYDLRELRAGFEGTANVAHRGTGQIKKHRAKARVSLIVGPAQILALYIGHKKRSILLVRFFCFVAGRVDEVLRPIHAPRLTLRTARLREPTRGVAKATADIEHTTALRWRMAAQHLVAMAGKPLY